MAENQQLLDYLKKVAGDLYETRERLRKLESGEQEPIAIVGMGCRLPGGVTAPEQLWDLLVSETDAVSEFPTDRGWDVVEKTYGLNQGDGGTSYTRVGGFVHDAPDFDAGFFGISPREALAMDPQQRMLLEVSWEALERAGIDPTSLKGSSTGVFVGANSNGYGMSLVGNESGSEGYLLTGGLTAVISGRVSYTLGLEGPAVTVDTACSSALVALHLAYQALRAGECSMALAGGVTVMALPSGYVEFSRQQGMAADGRCKAFSADADGIGWAEGSGMVLLERLSDARRNGHNVLAVIRGSAVNQDGASNGLTAPNGPSQQRVIRAALANGRLSTSDVDVVEAHGTGTALGDPIEAQALLATYGQDRPEDQPLWLGSMKSNIGHMQNASGVASVIKMVLALQGAMLPRTLYAEEPSPHIDWTAGNVRLLNEAMPWPSTGRPRRGGVSAFGVSGTNVHMILEEAPAIEDAAEAEGETPEPAEPAVPVLSGSGVSAWLVSGRSADALTAQAARLRELALARPELDPADVAWSLTATRALFENRAVVIGTERAELMAGLAAVATGQPSADVTSGVAPDDGAGRMVFVFPGQGSQWLGMGRELAECSPVFAARLNECAEALAPFVDWSLDDVLAGELGFEAADVVQPALWAVMVSLAAVWEAAGVAPDAVIGHSQGEIAAAVVAGILSLEDAARVVALRSKSLTVLAGKGGMLSIAEPSERVRERMVPYGDRVSLAAVNGPAATVVSGDPDALEELAATCTAEGVRARIIPVDYASHSAQVDGLEDEIRDVLRAIAPQAARIPMVSAMTGEPLAGPELDAGYWYASLRATVEFDRAVRVLAEDGHRAFLEVSPHPVLTGAISDTLEDAGVAASLVAGTLRREEGGAARLLTSFAEAHVSGVGIDWASVIEPATPVGLPTYAFQRQRFWPKPALVPQDAPAGGGTGSAAEARFWAAVEDGDLRELADTLAINDQRLSEVLPALASWRRRERNESVVADWRYRVSWAPVPDSGSAVLSGTWLLVTPDEASAQDFAGALTARGAETLTIEVGTGGLDRADLATRLGDLGTTVAGVLSLLPLDETPVPGFEVVPAGLAGSLTLIQALGDAGIAAPLWSVTRGAMTTGPGETVASPVQAQTWGLGRVAGLEHPDRWGGLIDLPPAWDDRTAARLCAVLADGSEDQVAIRPAGTVVRRLVRAEARRTASEGWTPRGTALLTGATGEIGPYVGRWLAARGAERVVLTSRSGPTAAMAAEVAALAEAGTTVCFVACDVAERSQVAGLLERLAVDGPPLRSVFHAANAGRMVSFDGTGMPELEEALGAKAAGAVWLGELTEDLDLDAFVLFSSIAATWGSVEHGAYATGNAFLDGYAEQRRSRGLPATSVAWGVWDTKDWAAVEAIASHAPGALTPARLRRQGMEFLDPQRALIAMDQAILDDETFIAIADVDWDAFAPVFRAVRPWPLLGQIPEVVRAAAAAPSHTAAAGPDGEFAVQLANTGADERQRLVVDLVRSHAAAVLGHGSLDAVSADRAFRDLGFDSLTAVELRNRLNTATGLVLPSTVVFDYPSATVLATEIIGRLLGVSQSSGAQQVVVSIDPAEPIAIVGMGCRFPGGAHSPQSMWDLLASGGDAISGFPTDRNWDMEGLFDPDPDNPGTSYVQEGGFLHAAADFDAGFFGISPREALAMDPQQRLLLEISWEALERAGIDPQSVQGSATGVFTGAAPSGYASQVVGVEGAEGHLITGNVGSVLSGRISYTLGLEGPAVTVDTACSSSLVALHLAAQALRTGECSMALAGGVMMIADPAEFIGFSRQRVLAADGRCKAFSADADGMGIAEGAGMVLLERLSDAQRNGHNVLAVIRGSAVNQDGASNGLTAPNGPSQQRVIKAALANAGLTAADVDAVEAHGTGTALGDPIEAQALIATYGQERSADRPLWLGSVKSNIGHAQQAAGVAGVIKMVLALRHGVLPATLYADEASPHVDWSADTVRLLTEPTPWPAGDQPRRAGVSAFGISGTNGHVILEEAPAPAEIAEPAEPATPVLSGSGAVAWLVSGRSAEAVAGQADRLREFALAGPELEPVDVAWSLATTRSTFEHRAVVIGSGREELAAGLAGRSVSGTARGSARVGFVFSGQGSQRAGMGAGLHAASSVFAEAFDRVCGLLEAELDLPVADVVLGRVEPEIGADATVFAQSGLFAFQVGVVSLLKAAGVSPAAVAGHSVGEFAAAWASGVLSLEDAARLVATRARLMQALPEGGGMWAIAAPEAEVLTSIEGVEGVSIAAVNGPSATVISGDADAVATVAESWRTGGARVRQLRVSHAFHSHLMDPVLDELRQAASAVTHQSPRLPWACGTTGEVLEGFGPDYWVEQARGAVRFGDAVSALSDRGVDVFVEIGPDGTLSGLGPAVVADGLFVPVSRPKVPSDVALLEALGRVHVAGGQVDWPAVFAGGRRVELPTYAFQHQRFWPETQAALTAGDVVENVADAGFWAAVEDGDVRQVADTLAVDDERLGDVLPALAAWRRRSREDSAVADWRYRVSWAQVSEPASATLSGSWLVVVPEGVSAQDHVQALTGRGAETTLFEVGEADRAVLAGRLATSADVAGIVSLLALGEAPVAGNLALVQALGDAGIAAPVWAVTHGAVSTGPGDAAPDPVQAQVWGFGRVAALEHPDRWGGLVDLPSSWDGRTPARLCAALSGIGEDQIAIRASGTMGRRLVRAAQPRTGEAWTPAGTVLITGGTGGIGAQVASWAAGRAARRVVLTSRSGPAAAGAGALAAELALAGTSVDVVACDIADRARAEALLTRIADDGPPLSSVIHAAGVGEAKSIEEFTPADLTRVSAVKVDGATVLDELTQAMDLDAFVVFSSVSAIWGSGLQPGYAAANAFLDAMVEERRSRGLVGTSLAWGLWGGAGMGAGTAGENLQRYGLRLMDPELGIRAMAQAIDAGEPVVAVADVDWQRFAPTYTLRRPSPLIEALPEVRQALAAPAVPVTRAESGLAERLTGLSRAEQDRILVDLIRTEAASVLGHTSADAVEADRAFSDLGFDSLTAVELRGRLGAATGLTLSTTLVFDYPSAEILAEHLLGEILGVHPASGTPVPVVTAAVEGEPIAIVGMSCRLPGGVASPDQLWDLVAAGTDAISAFPQDRGWEVHDPELAASNATYARVGGFVHDATHFDAGFFGISPREAIAMDPQQRLMLESLLGGPRDRRDRSGLAARRSVTGVFAGAAASGYDIGLMLSSDGEGPPATGNAGSVISGRIAYAFGLEGPAVTVDTACSSSLVALHLACQALRSGECTMALAGGVTVMATPGAFVEFCRAAGMSADGRCKPFSDDADGTGWAEGAGILVVERLSDAQRNGHPVLAVITGSAVNQDGASNGLTAPNGPSQQRVIRAALANARLSAADIDAVEAHGTGTTLGDPIEAQALLATYGRERSEDRPLWLGSVKSNIGHSQSASGVAGIIKMVLAMRHGVLPRTLHADVPSTARGLVGRQRTPAERGTAVAGDRPAAPRGRLLLRHERHQRPRHRRGGPGGGRRRRRGAGRSGAVGRRRLGVAGVGPVGGCPDRAGRTAAGVRARSPRARVEDVAWSLATRRSPFENRAVVVGSGREELAAGLAAVATGQPGSGVTTGAVASDGVGRTCSSSRVRVRSGWAWAVSWRSARRCSRPGWTSAPPRWPRSWTGRCTMCWPVSWASRPLTSYSLLCWAVMVSLAAVWEAAGVAPEAVVGHSQGEIAAACVAGILSLEDSARVVALRSKSLTVLAGKGGMLSVAEPADLVRERIAAFGDRLSLAAVNGPASTVVSGEPEALEELAGICTAEDVRARIIPVDYASHSAQVDALEQEIRDVLAEVTPGPARITMVSAMTGEVLEGPELDAGYWYASLRSPVEFDRAIRVLADGGHRTFVEASPHPVLTGAIGDTLNDADVAASLVTGTLRRDEGGAARLLASFAEAYVKGVHIDWAGVLEPGDSVDLPTYAFQRQRFWPRLSSSAVPGAPTTSGTAAEAGFWAAIESGDVRQVADTLDVDDDRLGELLPALAAWRRREQDDSAVADWRYRVSWVPVPDVGSPVLSGTWLVVAPDDASADEVARALTGRGSDVIVVETGQETDHTALTGRIAEALAATDRSRLSGVLSLLALDETPLASHPSVPAGLAATTSLVRALADAEIAAPLWSLTRGAVSTGPGDVLTDPIQAQAWGLGRVAALEHPDTWGGLIDLPQAWDERSAARLCAVLADTEEDQVAIRPSGILARRLVHAPPVPAGRGRWTTGGTALVTGGTGAIGGHVSRLLAERGAARLVLSSRSGAQAPGVANLAAELATAGTAVDVIACDIAQRSQAEGLLARIAAGGPPLTAVMHAAGVARGGAVGEVGPADLADDLAAKAAGAAWLDELTQDLDLDAFVLFSSGAAIWGSGRLGGYAAANAFLDAVAERRRAHGLAATSVAWGLWGGGGMVSGDIGDQLQRIGMRVMEPGSGIRALAQAMDNGDGVVTVADVDWEKFTPTFTLRRRSPLIESLPEVRQALADAAPAEAAATLESLTDLGRRLASLSEAEQRRMLTDLVRAEAAAVLGHASPDDVPSDRAFKDLGFDSLSAVELRNRLNAVTGLRLPSTLVFDYPTATVLAGHLRSDLLGVRSGAAQVTPSSAAADDEPIAIVGMSCRLPGGVGGPEQLWDLLASGTDGLSGFPTDRGWDVAEAEYRAGQDDAAAMSIARVGGFVYDATKFDAGFFGISPREALAMDPQQRMLLEVSWETLERAGIDPVAMRGTATGVFTGATYSGYGTDLGGADTGSEGYLLTGSLPAVISGRVSYTLGLEGPAVTVDTACSSALVALHLACQSLRSGECSMALAGGVAFMSTPGAFAEFSKQQGLAADGRCKAFSDDADGMGWAEGAGMLLVERLSDAQRNGHNVLAVIKGSAVNQDGASNGLTAPNGPSQQRVIRAALANAGLSPSDIDAVEAHGTGTTLGDPIEAQALIATYGQDRPEDRPLWLGAVKSNIGHPQAAAGAVGVIKMVLALQSEMLPRTLHADEPSTQIDWSAGNVRLLHEALPWPANERPRRAGVSAFGVSGTNVHMIVEEAPSPGDPAESNEQPDVPVLSGTDVSAWPVSGRSPEALTAQAGRLREFALARPELDPADVGWSLATTRSTFENRAVVVGSELEELAAGLAAVATGQPAAGVTTGTAPGHGVGRTVFVFPGQGSQWLGMGRELLECSPVFAARFAECAAALAPFVDWSLRDVLAGELGFEAADVVQPALWAVMVSLAAVWEAAGVAPDAVVGHSQGEIAAACVAGILSLEDSARVVALRSKSLTVLAGKGGMLSIAEPAGRVRERMVPYGDRVSLAAVNGPAATVVSGEPDALEELAATCTAEGVRARIIPVDYASHSAQVDALEDEIRRVLADVTPGPARITMVSAMTGEQLEGPELDAGYWYDSLRATVEFDRAVRVLADGGHRSFIEVSPHPVLTGAITDTLDDTSVAASLVVGTLRREEGGAARLLTSFAEAHVAGVGIDWAGVLEPGTPVGLPTYAFQHQHYWPEIGKPAVALPGGDAVENPADTRFWAAVEDGDVRQVADTLAVDDDRLGELLPALAAWRRRERDDSAVGGWRYRVSWTPVPDAGPVVLSGTWLLVVADAQDALVQDSARALTERGAEVSVHEIGANELDRATVAEGLAAFGGEALAGVLSLLAFDETPLTGFPLVPAGSAGTLLLAQALGDAGIAAPMWSLTRGAVATGPGETVPSPVQAQTWGLGRVIGLEHPDRWGGLVDLPPVWDDRTAARLCAVLADGGEDQVAIRPAGTVARRLVRAEPRRSGAESWTPRGTVLLTGATGEIGPHVGRWLAARGTERVVLTSRSGPTPALAAEVAAVAGSGTAVTVLACDIAERSQVAGLIDRITAGGPPLKTVIHAANTGRMVSFDGTGIPDLESALAAKAAGAVWLDELTADLDLDAFVLFSSIAATWGSVEHGAYAAGNAFLDALAQRRRSRGLPATSVAWGVWDTRDWAAVEAASSHAPGALTPERLQRQGMTFQDPGRSLIALDQVLADDETFLAVADVDWARFIPVYRAMRPWPLLDEIPEARQSIAAAPSQADAAGKAGELVARLKDLAADERQRLVVDLVRSHAAAVLGHGSLNAVSADRAFRDLGFDSLTAVELRNRLEHGHGSGSAVDGGVRLPVGDGSRHGDHRAAAGCLAGPPARSRWSSRSTRPSPSRSSAWAAASRAGWPRPSSCGTWSCPVGTPCRASRSTATGTWPGCSTRTRTTPVRRTCVKAASCTARPSSTRRSSGSRRVRPSRWTRSSGCCWRSRGRP